ncbi:adenosylhomocysteinase [Fibrobacter sp. UWOV1]|uniref:adenosylhomocysteinase n=1 Tax=Fibrobacter sp. UWOV1 TaxID=1896215 RepID=UPI000932F8CA|nr:adenosylhomocysteinase [Fibrobacter sp. UWOV1]
MLFSEIIKESYEPREYPALAQLSDEWVQTRPFWGCKVLVATPIFRNTLVEYRALMAGGADLYVGHVIGTSGAAMPCDRKIIDLLKEKDVPVVTDEDIKSGKVADDFDLILDCAGQFAFCHPRKGFVELTRSGVQFFEKSEHPVYVADSGIVKRIETVLGTGDGYFRALESLGFGDFEGKSLVVFGSGKVGCGIALHGVRRGMNVCSITNTRNEDSNSNFSRVLLNNEVQIEDYLDDDRVADVIAHADFVVTATGRKNALTLSAVSAILSNVKAVVANMGVEDEFGELVPDTRVLNRKSPLNFVLDEPTHLKYIDTSLALHAALGERLLQECAEEACPFKGVQDPPSEIEQRLLVTTIQNGAIGPEICDMMR